MNHSTDYDLTGLIHHPYRPPEGFDSPQPPTYKASTIYFSNVAAMRARDWRDKNSYTYGLHGTPTTFLLEERIAHLEGGLHTVLVPSGLSAISTTNLALLSHGDEVLIPNNAYGPNKAFADSELKRMGVSYRLYDPMDVNDLRRCISPATRLVWLEAPGSITMEFPDLIAQVRLCRERGVTVVLDNTWGCGLAFQPFDLLGDGSLGVDISVHALTKYPSGGGDVLMGGITTRNPDLHQRIKFCHMNLGLGISGNDAEAVLRSLPSIGLRYCAHDQLARQLAHWMAQQKFCAQVLHPALPSSPGHAHWAALCANGGHGSKGLAAGLFSVIFRPDIPTQQVDAFIDGLKLFKLGFSWGGPISLVASYPLQDIRKTPLPAHLQAKASSMVVRFSPGLESAEALLADLKQSASTHLAQR